MAYILMLVRVGPVLILPFVSAYACVRLCVPCVMFIEPLLYISFASLPVNRLECKGVTYDMDLLLGEITLLDFHNLTRNSIRRFGDTITLRFFFCGTEWCTPTR